MIFVKILIFLAVLLLLALPFLPLRRLPFTFCHYREEGKKQGKNYLNVLCVFIVEVVAIIFIPQLHDLAVWLGNLKPIAWLLSKIPTYVGYSAELAILIVVNIVLCALAIFTLAFVRGAVKVVGWIKHLIEKITALFTSSKNGRRSKKKKGKKAHRKKAAPPKIDPQLLPPPEEAPAGSKILIGGPTSEKKNSNAKLKGEDEDEPSVKETALQKLLNRLRSVVLEEVDDDWYVKPQMRHVAKHLRNFLVLVLALYLLSFALFLLPVLFHVRFLEEPFYRIMQVILRINYLYPSIALALLTEIFWVLNGKAAPVAPEDPAADPNYRKSGRIVDLDHLDNDLVHTLGKYYEVTSFYSNDVNTAQIDRTVVDLSSSPSLQDIADYVQSQGLELNQEYLLGIKYFQDGRNVLFHAPLYTAVGPYLFAALNLRIIQGERIVVICYNKSEIPNIIDSLQRGFLKVARTHKPLWRIVSIEEKGVNDETDVLVVTPEELQSDLIFTVHESFFHQVTVALLPDANLVVSANNYYCQIVAQRLMQNCKSGLQFLFLSTRNTENLDNYLTEYFLLRHPPENARGDYGYGDVHVHVWRPKQDAADFIDNAGQTMLPEVTICNIASQNGIPKPSVISDGAIYSNQVNTEWLELYDATERPLGFAVVSDDCCNLPGVIYAYSRYLGKKASVIHVLTRQYLLRNYFYAHAARYLFEEPLMQRSATEHAEPNKTQMVLLLCRLIQGMPLTTFISEMDRILGKRSSDGKTITFEAVTKMVSQCLSVSTGSPPSDSQEHFTIFVPQDEFYPEAHIRIREGSSALSQLLKETSLVRICFEGARQPEYLNLFARMIDQRFLPEQNLVFKNRNYRILNVDHTSGTLYVADASSSHGIAREYIQIRNYAMEDSGQFRQDCDLIQKRNKPSSDKVTGALIDFAGEETTVSSLTLARSNDAFRVISETMGYYMLNSDSSTFRVTDNSIPIVWLHEGQRDALRRSVGNGLYLKIALKRKRSDRLTMTLAALLQELMKTLFPDVYFCLSVCPILEHPEQIYQGSDFKSHAISQLYPQLSNWGPVCENCIELLIVEDCVGGTGAIDLLFEENATFLRNALWMLGEYLEWQKDNEPSPFIFFGMDTQPDIFDLDGLRPILQSFARNYVREHDVNSQLNPVNRCFLCGRKIIEPYLWHEKHTICKACSKEYNPDIDEAGQILAYAKQFLETSFNIQVPDFQIRIDDDLPGDALSTLEYDSKTITLAEDLPLRVVHVQILIQLVRNWQLENLNIDGNPMIDGQPLYVSLQYLRFIEQHQYVRYLHREYLLGKDDASCGYCSLSQALQAEGHENSFLYLLRQRKKNGTAPIKRTFQKKSTRKAQGNDSAYYYRSILRPDQAEAYDAILDGYMNQDESIDLSSFAFQSQEVERIHRSVLMDHPEIFWTNGGIKENINSASGVVSNIVPTYTISRDSRDQLQQEIDNAVSPFLSEITDEMGDYEVALKLYEKLIEFLDYDTIALERQQQNRNDSGVEGMDNLRNIYGAIVKHKSVCAGYAKAYQYLLQKLGIETLFVRGNCFEGGLHAWNVVRLEGDYYQTDVTWGDYSNTDPSKDRKGMSYAYFAVTDEIIRRSRSFDEEFVLPKCQSDSCNYYVRNELHFTKYDPETIRNALVQKLKDGSSSFVEFRFENARLLHDAEFFLCQNGGVFEAAKMADRDSAKFSHSVIDDMYLLRVSFE